MIQLSAKAYSEISRESIMHNAKRITFPCGYTKTTICNKAIFGKEPLGYEKAASKVNMEEKKKPQNPNSSPRNDSYRRAKQKIFEIAMLNDFTHFITFTLNKEYIDRYDGSIIVAKLKKWLSNMVSRHGLKYLLVSEYHKDNAIHFHGLVSGNLVFEDSGKRDEGRIIYNMPQWKLGFSTAEELYGEKLNTAKYITKYVDKDFQKILGNFYYAGGKVNRNAPVDYLDFDFDSIDRKIYACEATGTLFKYYDELEEATV